ncbi:MAG: prolyl oligopeptidase family serine peptidase [Anaerolineae bacterium]|jgi:uncharacterized protein|nr:prolyl oligopeptidase family serine peptidase [Anaerolineae bacterium]MBT7071623.1 prolyl oligopeptidase family serine peptidase [Anaerolineae bacterium]MBT7326422.1 prolyl oligopeptidase family serine peptidase [Anaerolineae bacterium]
MNKKLKILLVIVFLVIIAYFFAANRIYNMMTITHPNCQSSYMERRRENTPTNFKGEYDTPDTEIDVSAYQMESYEEVNFASREDNLKISGWFVPASTESDRTIIVVHGADMCKRNSNVLIASGMLTRNGFNVLMIDLRNHGDSEIVSDHFAAGTEEYRDVLGAYDWLLAQGYQPRNIGVMGVSMGAVTSINAFSLEKGVAAIWADSSFTDIPTVLEDQLALNGFPIFMKKGVLTIASSDGYNLESITPIKAIEDHAERPIMITHGTEDKWINVSAAEMLYANAGPNAELWIFEDAHHVESMFIDPFTYQERMVAFFENALEN